ncbi:hypothetical protein [Clostridium perfringens]
MRVLGRNMAWLIKCIELGKKNNILKPELEKEKELILLDNMKI